MSQTSSTISIESLNVHGGLREKNPFIDEYLQNKKPDILLLQESHLFPEEERWLNWANYTAHYNSTTKQQAKKLGQNRRRGVVILIANHLTHLITIAFNKHMIL